MAMPAVVEGNMWVTMKKCLLLFLRSVLSTVKHYSRIIDPYKGSSHMKSCTFVIVDKTALCAGSP